MRRLALAAALLLPVAAAAQEVRFPQLNWEADLGLVGVGTPSATDADREGTSVFLFGEVAAALPTENRIEASVGRELGGGFSADLGYRYARYAPEHGGGGLGTAHSILFRLGWTR